MKRRILAFALLVCLLLTGCGEKDAAADTELAPNTQVQSTQVQPSGSGAEMPPPSTPDSGTGPETEPAPPAPVPGGEPTPAPQEPAEPAAPVSKKMIGGIAAAAVVVVALAVWLFLARRKKRAAVLTKEQRERQALMVPAGETMTLAPDIRLFFRVGNLHNIGQREEQQDSFCISNFMDEQLVREKGLLAVVADGMGGLRGGATISQLVTDMFRDRYAQLPVTDIGAFLYDSVQNAETAVEEYIRNTGVDGGSTLVAVIIREGLLHFLTVGDSRLYLLRGGKLTQLNREHTFGNLLREKAARGEVSPDEPFVNPRRHALVAYVGMGSCNTMDRNERPIPLLPGDKVLLCSDGVYNALGEDALIAAMSGDALAAAQRLEDAILQQQIPDQDNFTGVLLECAVEKRGAGC